MIFKLKLYFEDGIIDFFLYNFFYMLFLINLEFRYIISGV